MRNVRSREVCPRLKADCARVYGLSLWSGCREMKVVAYGNVPLQTSRVLWGVPHKNRVVPRKYYAPVPFLWTGVFLFFYFLEAKKRIYKAKKQNFYRKYTFIYDFLFLGNDVLFSRLSSGVRTQKPARLESAAVSLYAKITFGTNFGASMDVCLHEKSALFTHRRGSEVDPSDAA